jgi:hypothetical protein
VFLRRTFPCPTDVGAAFVVRGRWRVVGREESM